MRLLLLYYCLFATSIAHAQATLQVTVFDTNLNEGLFGANVVLYQQGAFIKGRSTDPEGFAQINGVPAGTYSLEMRYTGYVTQLIEGIHFSADTLQLRVAMGEGTNLSCGSGPLIAYSPPLLAADDLTSGQVFTSAQIRPQTTLLNRSASRRSNTLVVEPLRPLSNEAVRRKRWAYQRYRQPARLLLTATSQRPCWAKRVNVHVARRENRLLVKSRSPLEGALLYTLQGELIRAAAGANVKRFVIPAEGIPAGTYRLVIQRKGKQVEGHVIL